MRFIATTTLRKILKMKKRLKFVQGGTSGGKTIAILQYLIDKAQQRDGIIISVVSESLPHLKLGAMRDFLNIMKGHNYYEESRWNRTDHTYTFSNGSIIEFFSADSGKATGPRRNVLFVNEGNNVAYHVFQDLELRTDEEIIVDYNPVGEFWAQTEIMPYHPHDFCIVTYRDNEGLAESIIRTIEARKHNTNWWRIHGKGEMGIREGQVYNDWRPIKEVPVEARLERIWLDFGFTNDPTAIGFVYRWNGGFILDEIDYRTGLKNRQIHKAIQAAIKERRRTYARQLRKDGMPRDEAVAAALRLKPLTIGDSSEPKSIKEIKDYGTNIIGATKGADSVDWGIGMVQDQEIYVTERSTNVWHEQRNYLWKVDRKTNKPLNKPEDDFNHHMDGMRYAITDILGNKKPKLKSRVSM